MSLVVSPHRLEQPDPSGFELPRVLQRHARLEMICASPLHVGILTDPEPRD
jgi:hypothetical protein